MLLYVTQTLHKSKRYIYYYYYLFSFSFYENSEITYKVNLSVLQHCKSDVSILEHYFFN